jgi:phosphoribosylformimino-5-aminoimidazole carboxamide ribotide isomerase
MLFHPSRRWADVARDGTETGAKVAMFSKVADAAGIPIIASGRVAKIEDLRSLKPLFAKHVVVAIAGRALFYERGSRYVRPHPQ